ncbi:MAG: SCO family protein [Pseudomonadota bacterium]
MRALVLSLLLVTQLASAADKLKAGVFEPPRMAPEIASGDFKLSAQRGKVVVLEFGYTSCLDVCPVSLAMLAQARQKLGDKLQVVFVTVDPERDTPKVLHEYVAKFDPSFVGITGSAAQMAAIRTAYGITATKKKGEGGAYTMGHSSYLYFIDPAGKLRALMPFGRPSDEIVHDVNLLSQK